MENLEANYPKKSQNRVIRGAKRAVYDKAQIHEILEASFLCYVGFEIDGQPHIIPI